MKPEIEKQVSLACYTTLQVEGVAEYFCRLTAEEQLPELVQYARGQEAPLWVFGGGSNVLITDGKLHRLVVRNELAGVVLVRDGATGDILVTAAAGEPWDVLVSQLVKQGLAGLENLSGIPGTVGAAPIQNINAYGAQVADVVESVRVFDPEVMSFRTLTKAECRFGYRDSVFKQPAGERLIVTAVTFRLSPAGSTNLTYRSSSQSIAKHLEEKGIDTPSVADVRAAILHVRSNIGMLEGQFRSAGSFFKNTVVSAEEFARINTIVQESFAEEDRRLSPWHWTLPDGKEKLSTAFLMECTPYNKRLYGEKRWHDVVGISPKHSLSIVTEAGATAADVQAFVAEIIAAVFDRFAVTIETEVNFIS